MHRSLVIGPPPSLMPSDITPVWQKWIEGFYRRLPEGPFKLPGYSRAALPSADQYESNSSGNAFSSLIYVYDANPGAATPTIAFSDGTNWISLLSGSSV